MPTPAEITIIGAVVFMYVRSSLDIFLLSFLVIFHCHCTNLPICVNKFNKSQHSCSMIFFSLEGSLIHPVKQRDLSEVLVSP